MLQKTGNTEGPLKKASFKNRYYPSITNIKDIMESKNIFSFSFQHVSTDNVKDIIKTINTKKACPDGNIPVKLIKINEDMFSRLMFQNFNQFLINGKFLHCLKQAEVIPVFEKEDKLDKKNYRRVSILPVISKIYERLMYDQMYKYFDQISSKFQCGFRKGFSTKNCLLYMIENWKESLDGHYGALLNDLSKVFDCIMHDLLIAKLRAYGFDNDSLKFICNYPRIKINSSFSTWSKFKNGVPQESLLGPLLFNTNTLRMFFEKEDVNFPAYADDNTPYCDKNLEVLLSKLQICALKLSEWFSNNYMKMNPNKCHLILSSNNENKKIEINGEVISNINLVINLEFILIENQSLIHTLKLFVKKVGKKLHTLARIINYMSTNQAQLLMRSLIMQFS